MQGDLLGWFSGTAKRATRGSLSEDERLLGMLIARRAGVFRGVTMRSVDDAREYKIPCRKRSWYKPGGFSKRNKTRYVPLDAPTRTPPEKQNEQFDLDYYQKRSRFGRTYQVTLGPWIGWQHD